MANFTITGPDGKSYNVTAPDDATEDQVLAYAQKSYKMAAAPKAPEPSKPFGQQLNEGIADIPRQIGLTARAGLRAFDGTANLIGAPIRAGINSILPDSAAIGPINTVGIAEKVGLPRPRPGTESWVNDAATMGFGASAPMAGGAALAKTATGATTKAVGNMLASNPGAQIVSGGAAGAAGGYTRETGGNDTSQLLASLGAGIAAPFAMNAASRVGQSIANAGQRMMSPPIPQVQVDVTINSALKDSGLNLSQLPAEVAAGIRSDVGKAMQIGGNLSPDAVRRLADYRLTGATPTAAKLTLDPAAVSQQENLAKLGINSKDPAAQMLGQTKNANNRQLVTGLNALGANTADDAIAGSTKVMSGVSGYNDRATGIISKLYDKAKTSDGRSAALDPKAFTERADELLTFNLRNAELPADIRTKLNSFASGETPLTVETAEQFKTIMAKLQRTSSDGGVRDAISHVRTALEEAPLLPGQEMGAASQVAFSRARNLHRQYMGLVEKTPALQAVRDGIEPDKFVQQFIVGAGPKSNVMDVAMLKNSIKSNPVAMDAVREQITSTLKKSALNGAEDEVGNFSQSAYNKALTAIGDRKLRLFFEPEQINQMKAIGRVASYEQFQPAGTAINNSNTAGTGMAAMLDRIASSPMLSKIPFGKLVQDPMQNIAVGMQAKGSMNVPRSLVSGQPQAPLLPAPQQPAGLMLSPAMFGNYETEEQKKRRLGLLFP